VLGFFLSPNIERAGCNGLNSTLLMPPAVFSFFEVDGGSISPSKVAVDLEDLGLSCLPPCDLSPSRLPRHIFQALIPLKLGLRKLLCRRDLAVLEASSSNKRPCREVFVKRFEDIPCPTEP